MLPDLHRAGESDDLHAIVGDHRRADVVDPADEEAEHRPRQTGFVEDFGEFQRGEGRAVGRLQQHRRAGRDGRGKLVGDLVQRMVEGRDRGDQLDRVARGEDLARLAVGRDVAGEDAAVVAQRLHRREVEHVGTTGCLVLRLTDGEAGLAGDQRGEFVAPFRQEHGCLAQDVVAVAAGQRFVRKGQRGGDRLLEVLRADQGGGAGERPVPGVTDFEGAAGGDRLAGDVGGKMDRE